MRTQTEIRNQIYELTRLDNEFKPIRWASTEPGVYEALHLGLRLVKQSENITIRTIDGTLITSFRVDRALQHEIERNSSRMANEERAWRQEFLEDLFAERSLKNPTADTTESPSAA